MLWSEVLQLGKWHRPFTQCLKTVKNFTGIQVP